MLLLLALASGGGSPAAPTPRAAQPWGCSGQSCSASAGHISPSNGCRPVVGGVTYKTTVALVQDGFPTTPFVSTNRTRVKLSSVKATAYPNRARHSSLTGSDRPAFCCCGADQRGVRAENWDAGVSFSFAFPNPYEFSVPPSATNGIVGFDVGSYGMTKDSTRMLCIPPEEGYGTVAGHVGIPANSTLLLEIKCEEIDLPSDPVGLPCDPHAKPAEHCPGGAPCPPSGVCPAPPPPPPAPPPPPPPSNRVGHEHRPLRQVRGFVQVCVRQAAADARGSRLVGGPSLVL